MIGPTLPSHVLKTPSDQHTLPNIDEEQTTSSSIGPCLPVPLHPESSNSEEHDDKLSAVNIGPSLPPHLFMKLQNSEHGINNAEENGEDDMATGIGPSLPPLFQPTNNDDDSEDDYIGPSIPSANKEQVKEEYLMRLAFIKAQREIEKNTPKREEWMTSLPAKMANYGLGPRQFSKSSGNASSEMSKEWTETPEQKRRRMAGDLAEPTSQSELERKSMAERDMREERRAETMNKNRGKALLDQHRKRNASDNPEEDPDVINGRRSFNIERDMSVRGLSGQASTEEIKERCGELNSRFGHGKSQKFL